MATVNKTMTLKEFLDYIREKRLFVAINGEQMKELYRIFREHDITVSCMFFKIKASNILCPNRKKRYLFAYEKEGKLIPVILHSPLGSEVINYGEDVILNDDGSISLMKDIDDDNNAKLVFDSSSEFVEYLSSHNVVVNVRSEKEALQFTTIVEEHGVVWSDGELPSVSTCYSIYTNRTCYRVWPDYVLSFSSVSYYRNNGFDIIKFSDIYIRNRVI